MARILERYADKWFKPAKGQFQIFYKTGSVQGEYVPDFVAETSDRIHMIEVKSAREMEDSFVLAKKEAAKNWCRLASEHNLKHGGKPWSYSLIAHDLIGEHTSLEILTGL